MARRTLLVAFLVYLTLDLSLATMPGAFVFDASDSVEGLQAHRGPNAPQAVLLPALACGAPGLQQGQTSPRVGLPRAPVRSVLVEGPCRPRTFLAATPPSSSEDPH
jgi:hypothetical protein